MDDLFDTFELPVETRLRLRMMENKRRTGHRILRGGAIALALVLVAAVVGVQQLPGYVAQVVAPLQQVTNTLHS